jgi:PEP-CTERM motif
LTKHVYIGVYAVSILCILGNIIIGGKMKTTRNTTALVVTGAFFALSIGGAIGKPITYTFTGTGDITGTFTNAAGVVTDLGGPRETLTFTAVSDTSSAVAFDLGSGLPHGWTNPTTTALFTVTSGASVVAEGTFSSSDGIFVSIDNVNGGLGIGSTFPSFPGQPVYPFGLRPDPRAEPSISTYDLQSDITFTAPAGMGSSLIGGLSCLGFPSSCQLPTALALVGGGDLVLEGAGDGSVFNVTDAATFAATTMSTPEPSTWAMMLFGFAGLGYAGYRRAKETRAAL